MDKIVYGIHCEWWYSELGMPGYISTIYNAFASKESAIEALSDPNFPELLGINPDDIEEIDTTCWDVYDEDAREDHFVVLRLKESSRKPWYKCVVGIQDLKFFE